MKLVSTSRPLLYTVSLDINPSIVDELDSMQWHNTSAWATRLTPVSISGFPLVESLCARVMDSQYSLLATMFSNKRFSSELWPMVSLESFIAGTKPFVELCCDLPGFNTGIHIDHRSSVCTGMIALSSGCTPTEFYTSVSGADCWVSPYTIGSGWYSANSHWAWHRGRNISEGKRYSIKFGVDLAL